MAARLKWSELSPLAVVSGAVHTTVPVLIVGTNNAVNAGFVHDAEDAEAPYAYISSDAAIQTAKPKILEQVINLQVGEEEGNREFGLYR